MHTSANLLLQSPCFYHAATEPPTHPGGDVTLIRAVMYLRKQHIIAQNFKALPPTFVHFEQKYYPRVFTTETSS